MSYNFFVNRIIPNNLGYNIYEYLYRSKLLKLNEKENVNYTVIGNGHFPKRIAIARNKNNELEYKKIIIKDIDDQLMFSKNRIGISKEIIYFYPYEEFEYHKSKFIYDYLKSKTDKKIKMVINNNYLKESDYYHFDLYRYDYFSTKKDYPIKYDFNKKFLFLNNKQHVVRDKIYDFVMNNDMIEKNSNYSFIYKNIDLNKQMVNKDFYEICEGEKCFYKTHSNFLMDDYLSNNIRYFFENSFLYVAAETNPFLSFNFLTEKTYKAFYHGVPFMLISSARSLEHLKTLGFKTFDKWIDESYDKEKKIKNRINMIFNEIKRINNLNIDELIKIKKEMKSTLEYNKNMYLSNMNQEFVNFFNRLVNE